MSFTLHGPEGELGPLILGVPGLHNARNAALAWSRRSRSASRSPPGPLRWPGSPV